MLYLDGNGQETLEKTGVGRKGSCWAVVLKKKKCFSSLTIRRLAEMRDIVDLCAIKKVKWYWAGHGARKGWKMDESII